MDGFGYSDSVERSEAWSTALHSMSECPPVTVTEWQHQLFTFGWSFPECAQVDTAMAELEVGRTLGGDS